MALTRLLTVSATHLMGLLTGVALLSPPPATGQFYDFQSNGVQEDLPTIHLFVGRSTIVPAPWPVKTVSVTDPKIANVEVLTAQQVLIMGKSAGSTDIVFLSEGGENAWQARIDIDVDVARIKADLMDLFSDCALDVRQSEDVVIVTGIMARGEQVERMHAFLDQFDLKYVDMTKLAGVQQVRIEVRIAEASRTAIRALGIDTTLRITTEHALGPPLGPAPPVGLGLFPQVGSDFGTATVGPTTGLATLLAGFPHADLEFFLDALAENQYLRILAEPNLVALSGEEASFLAGGEFPVPSVQGSGGGSTSISIDFKEFGVRLRFRPTVLGDNMIRLEVAPEVSELSDIGGIVIEGFQIPSVLTRKMQTTVVLRSGQTFGMAGLLQESIRSVTTGIPGLSELPVIGALFRSVRYERGETELIVLVTASLVEPVNLASDPPLPGALHISPNDWELYLEGRIEGRPPPKISPADAVWLKEAGLDRLRGPGSWATYDEPAAPSQPTVRRPQPPADEEGGSPE